VLGCFSTCFHAAALAQLPPPPPPPTTLWSFLGIPQGYRYIRDNGFNRSGNRPGLERKPPLKAIADPKNLESADPSIKKAAEVKQAEDLKKQKIKAVKYLASIGCGCYNRDGSITDAMIKSLDDCTEDVRFATAQAIAEAAAGEQCKNCKMKSCCSEEISNKLYEIAYERDENGCFLEPSERVRMAAAEALRTCCQGNGDMMVMEPGPTPAPQTGGEQPALAPEVGGERPGAAPPVLIDPTLPAVPLQNTPSPVPVPVPIIPPRAAPPAPAPAASLDPTQTSRRTAMLKAQPSRNAKPAEKSVAFTRPLPPIDETAYEAPAAAPASMPIRVTPHWTPTVQQSVYFRDTAGGPFPINHVVINPSPESVVVVSLPDRNQVVASKPSAIDETLGLAPIVAPDSVKRPYTSARLIPSAPPSASGAPVVLPASVRRPSASKTTASEPTHQAASPVLTSDVSLDQPAKPALPKAAAPRQLPGAEFGTGSVTSIRLKDGTALIEFNTDSSLPAGSLVRVYHQYALVAKKAVCDLQVIESENGRAVAIAHGRSQLSDVAVGDRAVVLQ
jgi:hypothetical protein